MRVRFWLLTAGGIGALLLAYGGMRVGWHQWCVSEGDRPAYCAYDNGHHWIYLALGLCFLVIAVLLFALARLAKSSAR